MGSVYLRIYLSIFLQYCTSFCLLSLISSFPFLSASKLRKTATAGPDGLRDVIFKIDLDSGHFSASDRYKYLREKAWEQVRLAHRALALSLSSLSLLPLSLSSLVSLSLIIYTCISTIQAYVMEKLGVAAEEISEAGTVGESKAESKM